MISYDHVIRSLKGDNEIVPSSGGSFCHKEFRALIPKFFPFDFTSPFPVNYLTMDELNQSVFEQDPTVCLKYGEISDVLKQVKHKYAIINLLNLLLKDEMFFAH